jgi:acetyl esterase
VASVAYRKPPEHAWPAPVEDALAGAWWVARHAARFGGDGTRLALAGDSAGAGLATAVARRLRDEGGPAISGQALVYPPAAGGHPGDYPSHQRHAEGPTLTLRTMDYFSRQAFGPEGRAPDEDGAPLRARDLRGLPPALVMLAAYDPLRDEGVAYAEALRRAGNAVTLVEYHGLAHGFISMGGGVAAARLAQRQLAAWLRQALAMGD